MRAWCGESNSWPLTSCVASLPNALSLPVNCRNLQFLFKSYLDPGYVYVQQLCYFLQNMLRMNGGGGTVPVLGRPNPMERTYELCEFRTCMPAASSQRSKHEFILDLECSLQHVNPVLAKSAWMNYWCQGGAMQSLYPKAACLLIHGGRAQRPAGWGHRWLGCKSAADSTRE
jgi:hypothetical protein